MRRPRRIPVRPELTDSQRRALAERAVYVGSHEYKSEHWWGGLPEVRQLRGGRVGRRGKQTTTICLLTSDEDRTRATTWLRGAIRSGEYKGWPIDEDERRAVFD